MHQFRGQDGTTFHYNGDFSGDITLSEPDPEVLSITVSMRDLLAFVAEYVRAERTLELESAEPSTLLGVDMPPY